MTAHPSNEDTYIPYGRGGAGNMRRRSSIRESWFQILASNTDASQSNVASSPGSQHAASKSEPRRRSTNSSMWSASTAGHERRSIWRRWLGGRRKDSVAEETDDKGGESEDREGV